MEYSAQTDARRRESSLCGAVLLQGSHLVEQSIDGLLNNPGSTVSDVCLCGDRRRADADVCERGSEPWRHHRPSLSPCRGLN